MGQLPKKRKKVITTLYLTEAQAKWSKDKARRDDTTQAHVIRTAIDKARATDEIRRYPMRTIGGEL